MATQVPLLLPYIHETDNNGAPLAGGKIYTYAAGTTTPKTTYTDSTGVTPNSNPVILDSAGRAAIWGTGSYKIVVKDANDATIRTDDNYTAFSSSSTSAFSDSAFTIQNASDATKQVQFSAASVNTASTTVITVPNGNDTMVTRTGTQTLTGKTLTSPTITTPVYTAEATVASATTTDLASGSSNYVAVSGTTTITSFGSNAATTNPIYFVRFTGALTLTHNATSLILPGAANITTAAGDALVAKYEGSGNWRVLQYTISANSPSGSGLGNNYTTQNQFFDHFNYLTTPSTSVWATVNSGTGAGFSYGSANSSLLSNGEPNNGIITMTCGTTTTGTATLWRTGQNRYFTFGAVDVSWRVRFGTVSTGTNRFTSIFGLINANSIVTSAAGQRGIFFRCVDSVNSGNWQCVCADASTETVINTSIAGSTSYKTFRFVVNSAGTSVQFYIDGASQGSITTNIYTGATFDGAVVLGALGTTNTRELIVDLCSNTMAVV